MVRLISLVVILWLAVGAAAAGQRHYYSNASRSCAHVGTVAVTVLAGPLNYTGVNPKVTCHLPTPST